MPSQPEEVKKKIHYQTSEEGVVKSKEVVIHAEETSKYDGIIADGDAAKRLMFGILDRRPVDMDALLKDPHTDPEAKNYLKNLELDQTTGNKRIVICDHCTPPALFKGTLDDKSDLTLTEKVLLQGRSFENDGHFSKLDKPVTVHMKQQQVAPDEKEAPAMKALDLQTINFTPEQLKALGIQSKRAKEKAPERKEEHKAEPKANVSRAEFAQDSAMHQALAQFENGYQPDTDSENIGAPGVPGKTGSRNLG